MITRDTLMGLIVKALEANRGSARYVDIGKYIWKNYKEELRDSGDIFYT